MGFCHERHTGGGVSVFVRAGCQLGHFPGIASGEAVRVFHSDLPGRVCEGLRCGEGLPEFGWLCAPVDWGAGDECLWLVGW